MPAAKSPRQGWKTGDQLEYLLSEWEHFRHSQDAKTLDRFWQRVFDQWYSRWPLPPPSASYTETARFMSQKEKNKKIKTWFNNRCRTADSSKTGRGDLKLDVTERRKLAALQAYCSYAWESTLRQIVLLRWEQEKHTMIIDDDDDPVEDPDGTPCVEACIPLTFKLKIAKELYDNLTPEEKKEIDIRREEDRKKLYRKIPEIGDAGERAAKLQIHARNQPLVRKSLARVLGNLEDQSGCIAQVLVASVDPEHGNLRIQKFCQGKTEHGLDFETLYGEDWAENVERKFGEWAVRSFGDKDSARRGIFTLPKDPTASSQAATSEGPSGESISEDLSFVESGLPQESVPTTSSKKSGSRPTKSQKAKSRAVAPRESSSRPSTSEELAPQPPASHGSPPTVSSIAQATGVSGLHVSTPAAIPPAPGTVVNPLPAADNDGEMALFATAVGVHQLLSQVAVTPQITQVTSTATSENPGTVEPVQLVVNPSQLFVNSPQIISEPRMSPPESSQVPTEVAVMQSSPTVTSVPPTTVMSTANATTIDSAPKAQYRVRNSANPVSGVSSRRGSIDGAPEMEMSLLHTNAETPLHQDTIESGASELTVDLREYLSIISDDGESHISSSQKSLDGCQDLLPPPPPPDSQLSGIVGGRVTNQAQSALARTHPQLDVAEGDLPSWMVEKGRWKYIVSTADVPAWEGLLKVYLRQERRLEFRDQGATITAEGRPLKIKDYFRYAHQPSRGDSLTVPSIGVEVAKWWGNIQPQWRRDGEDPPPGASTWSYILSGGSKGAFLVIMCLAWWGRAHARYLKEEISTRRIDAEATGLPANFDDLADYDAGWLKVVGDVAFVMEKAQRCDIHVEEVPAKRKREADPTSPPRKKSASRKRSKA